MWEICGAAFDIVSSIDNIGQLMGAQDESAAKEEKAGADDLCA
jgi:hypothetical protein